MPFFHFNLHVISKNEYFWRHFPGKSTITLRTMVTPFGLLVFSGCRPMGDTSRDERFHLVELFLIMMPHWNCPGCLGRWLSRVGVGWIGANEVPIWKGTLGNFITTKSTYRKIDIQSHDSTQILLCRFRSECIFGLSPIHPTTWFTFSVFRLRFEFECETLLSTGGYVNLSTVSKIEGKPTPNAK